MGVRQRRNPVSRSCRKMIEAGAKRIGTSSGIKIVEAGVED